MYFSNSYHHTGMRLSLKFLFLFLITGNFVSAQKDPIVKIYAFKQPVLPGIKKDIIVQENGKTIETTPPQKVNYFFYLEQKKSTAVKIAGIWMYGKKYFIKVDAISNTPVEIAKESSSNKPGKISLTPAEGNEFVQILPGAETKKGTKLPRGLRKIIQQSELVVIYVWEGKTWYLPVKQIKNLSSVVT